MLLGIFDIYNISEFHYTSDGWFKIITTALLSGLVAFFAAWLQIWFHKKHEIETINKDNETKREIILDNVSETIKIIESDLLEIQDYKNNITLGSNNGIEVKHFSNFPIKILTNFSYKDVYEIFKNKIEITDSGNMEGFKKYYSSLLTITEVYKMLHKEIYDFFKLKNKLLKSIEEGHEKIASSVKQIPHDLKNNSVEMTKTYYDDLHKIVYNYFDIIEINEKQNSKKRKIHEIYEELYWALIKAINKKEYNQLNNFDFRKELIIEIKNIRRLKSLEESFKNELENRKRVLNQSKYLFELFHSVFQD